MTLRKLRLRELRKVVLRRLPWRRKSSFPYLTGDTLRVDADAVLDRASPRLDPRSVPDGGVVFVAHRPASLRYFFDRVHPRIRGRYVLVTHNSICRDLRPFLEHIEDERLLRWFGKNMDGLHEKAQGVPVGVINQSDPRRRGIDAGTWDHLRSTVVERDLGLLVNHDPGRPHQSKTEVRRRAVEHLKGIAGVHIMRRQPWPEYAANILRARFVLSPPGEQLDCFRTWEALLLGAYPIVLRNRISPLYEGLPVVQVADFGEIDEAFLDAQAARLAATSWDLERLFAPFWIREIRSWAT
jgi:hypothetical protein